MPRGGQRIDRAEHQKMHRENTDTQKNAREREVEQLDFERMVARLEASSHRAPGAYRLRVALLALLGFAVLALVVGLAGAGIAVLVIVPLALLWIGGIHALAMLFGVGKLLLLMAVPLWFLIKASVSALLTRFPVPQGVPLTRAQAPALFSAMDGMRQRMKGPRFHQVLVCDEMNAAVAQRPLFGLAGLPRNYLILGLPLLESLSPDEALAVVAHEYGHLAGSHSRFAAFIYRLRNSWGTIHVISHHWQGRAGALLRRLVGWYAPYFNAYTFVLARTNEYHADAASAELVGAAVAASALKRVDVCGAQYGHFLQQTFRLTNDTPAPPGDLAARWGTAVQTVSQPQAQRWLERALAVPARAGDTHPPLRERLRALQGDDLADLPAPLCGPTAAQAWLGQGLATVRVQVASQWCDRVAEPWRQQYDEAQKQRRRLDELRGMADINQDAQLERLQLRLSHEPGAALAEDVAAFIAAYPSHAVGPFIEGSRRLLNSDDSGLDWLDHAMALEPLATKAVCEKAFAYLSERGDAQAEAYQQRWNERDRWETAIAPQLQKIDLTHPLLPPKLAPAQREVIEGLVSAQRSGIARAYLARRVLPVDPGFDTYVLALELEPSPPRTELPELIINRVAGQGWPVHVIVCVLDGPYKPLRLRLQALPGAALAWVTPRA